MHWAMQHWLTTSTFALLTSNKCPHGREHWLANHHEGTDTGPLSTAIRSPYCARCTFKGLQHFFANIAEYSDAATGGLFGAVAKGVSSALDEIEHVAREKVYWTEDNTEKWFGGLGREMIEQNGPTCASSLHSPCT